MEGSMRVQLITAAAVLLLSAAGATAQTVNPSLVGTWKSAPDQVKLTTDFDKSVWGSDDASDPQTDLSKSVVSFASSGADFQVKLTTDFDKSVWGSDASSVRTVDLVVRQAGDATLTVTKKVVDARGRAVPASTWIEEVRLTLGPPQDGVAARVEHDTQVVTAVRRFPDDPGYKWNLDGLRVKVVTFKDGDGSSIEIRYDTPEGRGSFWETLRRDRAPASKRSSG